MAASRDVRADDVAMIEFFRRDIGSSLISSLENEPRVVEAER